MIILGIVVAMNEERKKWLKLHFVEIIFWIIMAIAIVWTLQMANFFPFL